MNATDAPCPNFAQVRIATDVFFGVAGALGIIGSVLLIRATTRSSKEQSVLTCLAKYIAIVDLLINALFYIPPISDGFATDSWVDPVLGIPGLCKPLFYLLRFFQLQSALLAALIALGVFLAALKRKDKVELLRPLALASCPTAFVLNIGYLISPATWDPAAGHCKSHDSIDIWGVEMAVIFILIISLHIFSWCYVWSRSPRRVARKAFRRATGYILAYVLSWTAYVVSIPLIVDKALPSCQAWWLKQLRAIYVVNGFLNYLAYREVGAELIRRVILFGPEERFRVARQQPIIEDQDAWILFAAKCQEEDDGEEEEDGVEEHPGRLQAELTLRAEMGH